MSAKDTSYGQVLRSSILIGGSSLINIAFGIIRSKAMALLIGPAGIGYLGVYTLIVDLSVCLAGLGVNNSGVRQIAEANSTHDETQVARTAIALKWTTFALGCLGGLALALLALPLSHLTFSDGAFALGIACLGLAVFFRLTAAGQTALILGLRRISDVAMLGILGTAIGTPLTIAIIYFWREDGIVASIVVGTASMLLMSWWYVRKVKIQNVPFGRGELVAEARPLLALGVAFMVGELLTMATAFVVRLLLIQHEGIVGAGLYQAAWTLGGIYIGFILQAMGADFYPRLTEARDDERSNQLINEQTEIGLLIGGPGLIATLVLAPTILTLLYSSEFSPAASALRWICLGMALRIMSWPLGFLPIARGARRIFVSLEIAATVAQLGLTYFLVPRFGVDGAASAFFGMYIWHTAIVYIVARRMSGFRYTAVNLGLISALSVSVVLVLGSFYLMDFWYATLFGVAFTCVISVVSLIAIIQRVPTEDWPKPLRRLIPLAERLRRVGA
ncbi:MAG: O-antigen translocase [Rhizobiaceae bacterium]|nr:O-antigen translocase [Rhizobiaceae bacterium]